MTPLLLGAALTLTQYVGTWNCAKPTVRSGYHTTLHVTPTGSSTLQFISTGDAGDRDRGLLFDLTQQPDGTFVLRNPDYPYPLTGMARGHTVVFAPPAPKPQRFQLQLSHRGTQLSYVSDTEYGFKINLRNRTTVCTR